MNQVARRTFHRLRSFAAGALALPALVIPVALARAEAPPSRPPNVVVLVVDTLRADRLGAYGNTDGLTPFLDSLAARACVFRNAYAQSSWTLPSVASLFTSRFPSQHHVVSFDAPIANDQTTLAQALRQRGYVTGGFSANDLVSSARGFAQGFDRFTTFGWGKTPAEAVTREALSWLDTLPPEKPVFLYLQYMEPHPPYRPLPATLARLSAGRGHASIGVTADADFVVLDSRRWSNADPQALVRLRDLYDAEVSDVDAQLGGLFEALRSRGFMDNALAIVTADHGEELMDHGRVGHGVTLYQEVIHVPLIAALPHSSTPRSISSAVSLIDVAPTILDLATAAQPASFRGRSLAPLLEGRGGAAPPASDPGISYSELVDPASERVGRMHDRALLVGTHKLIARATGGEEAYDIASDPGEKNPQGLSSRDRQALRRILARMPHSDTGSHAARVRADEITRERFRLLGYDE